MNDQILRMTEQERAEIWRKMVEGAIERIKNVLTNREEGARKNVKRGPNIVI